MLPCPDLCIDAGGVLHIVPGTARKFQPVLFKCSKCSAPTVLSENMYAYCKKVQIQTYCLVPFSCHSQSVDIPPPPPQSFFGGGYIGISVHLCHCQYY